MKEQSTETVTESRPVWEGLEAFAGKGFRICCSECWRKRSRRCWVGGGTGGAKASTPGSAIATGSGSLAG